MKYNRASGILLHPTSLPGPDGMGDIGPEAYRWIDFLSHAGCRLWQILPLGPTGYGDSPYQCFSAFAGNPYLVSPALLLEEDLITSGDLPDRPAFPSGNIEYGVAIQWKITLLDRAYDHFVEQNSSLLKNEFKAFQASEESWLKDYTLFMAIKESLGGGSWEFWPDLLRMRDETALKEFTRSHSDAILRHAFRQFLFFRQWKVLRGYAAEKHITIIGDIPIFVSFDSADAWSHPELFYFDEHRRPTAVAGVPPDYFSPTGQLWGNPLYKWEVHQETAYQWWIERLKATFRMVDIVRLDHFRGFAGYWRVKAGSKTAEKGRWVKGPGAQFFSAVSAALGELPIIAEDLGEITPDVFALRDQFGLPGMKILQFGIESCDPADPFLPHNYPEHCVAYTGTHDNDTSLGWYRNAKPEEQDFCRRYFARSGEDIAWDFIRAAWSSVAVMVVAPMQDFLNLDTTARMNYPGNPSGNWGWRMPVDAENHFIETRIREMNFLYNRLPLEESVG